MTGRSRREELVELSVGEAVRVRTLVAQSHEVDHVDDPHPQ